MIKKISLMLMLTGIITACTSNISPDTLSPDNANQLTPTTHGKIVSIHMVNVSGNKGMMSNAGAIAGGVGGAIAGSALGGGSRVPLLGALAGAAIGGVGGNYAQEKLSTQQAMQYVIKTDAGNLVTIVQGVGKEKYHLGQYVYIVEGEHAHIVNTDDNAS